MSYYAIGIGGTGGKCLEALIHLAACGLMPDSEPLYLLFVDKDGSNGSVSRASKLIQVYNGASANRVAGTELLKTPLQTAPAPVWSPVPENYNDLLGFLNYEIMDPSHRALCDVLFSPEEIKLPLEKGFRGHPSIGSVFMANTVDLENIEPWRSIQRNMLNHSQNKDVKLMLFGSIFGGTGAAGFPTIARLLDNWKGKFKNSKLQIGGALMLPYFSFDPVEGQGLKVDSKDFALSTQSALQYYAQKEELAGFDATFFIGSDDPRKVRSSALGGQEQENDPHWAELYAALAAIEFYRSQEQEISGYHFIAREKSESLRWDDISNKDEARGKILQMARFSFAFLSSYYPTLLDIVGDGLNIKAAGRAWRAPWYVDFFERQKVDVRRSIDSELNQMREYCLTFLWWFGNIEYSVTGNFTEKANLVKTASFIEEAPQNKFNYLKVRDNFNLSDFQNLTLPKPKSSDLADLWDRISQARPTSNNESWWIFLNELYRQCGE